LASGVSRAAAQQAPAVGADRETLARLMQKNLL
jgi:hypothetical protein